ncbi:hypothetical protein PVAP13_6NG283403 [Panicum virgatum]|uniref:Uncharacterized protein n=1 Tax=Panicum virgatum TaxID=38727 RepID=A0A8T0R1G2_PANVG|nr:hypothetical protein PVAP13_6NG283403 [Panicum virgatum]
MQLCFIFIKQNFVVDTQYGYSIQGDILLLQKQTQTEILIHYQEYVSWF